MNTTARESTRARNITRNDNINEHNSQGKYKSKEYNEVLLTLKKNVTDKQPTYVESGCSDINIHVYKIYNINKI